SRKHCIIAQVGESLVVRDLGSTNGIRVNGVRVEDGTLRTGDELTIGNFRYQVHIDQRREVMPAPAPAPVRPAAVPARKEQPAVSEDDLLGSADGPVPLPEPTGGRPRAARAPRPRTVSWNVRPEDGACRREGSVLE